MRVFVLCLPVGAVVEADASDLVGAEVRVEWVGGRVCSLLVVGGVNRSNALLEPSRD